MSTHLTTQEPDAARAKYRGAVAPGLQADHVTVWRWVQRYALEASRYLHGSSWCHTRCNVCGASSSGFDPTANCQRSRM